MSFVLHVKATSLHIKYDSLSSLTFKLLYIILCGPRVVVNIDVDNKTEWLQGDHLKENMPTAESQIPACRSSSPPCPPPNVHFPPTRNWNWPERCFWRVIFIQPNGPELRLKTPVTLDKSLRFASVCPSWNGLSWAWCLTPAVPAHKDSEIRGSQITGQLEQHSKVLSQNTVFEISENISQLGSVLV